MIPELGLRRAYEGRTARWCSNLPKENRMRLKDIVRVLNECGVLHARVLVLEGDLLSVRVPAYQVAAVTSRLWVASLRESTRTRKPAVRLQVGRLPTWAMGRTLQIAGRADRFVI